MDFHARKSRFSCVKGSWEKGLAEGIQLDAVKVSKRKKSRPHSQQSRTPCHVRITWALLRLHAKNPCLNWRPQKDVERESRSLGMKQKADRRPKSILKFSQFIKTSTWTHSKLPLGIPAVMDPCKCGRIRKYHNLSVHSNRGHVSSAANIHKASVNWIKSSPHRNCWTRP